MQVGIKIKVQEHKRVLASRKERVNEKGNEHKRCAQ